MYAYLKGILKSKTPSSAVIENYGIGYEVKIGTMTYNDLPEPPEEVMLYLYHYLREDAEDLYGFSGKNEKKLFEMILTVSKIGPGKALNIISQVTPYEFTEAVKCEDINMLSSIKGIGKKTAERIILDLKDRLPGIMPDDYAAASKTMPREKIEEVFKALLSLGYREGQARDMISSLRDKLNPDDSVEEILKKVFRHNG